MLPVQNASENIAILFMNFRKTEVKSEEKPLKFITVCDQYSIILIPSHWQQSKKQKVKLKHFSGLGIFLIRILHYVVKFSQIEGQ